MKDLKGNLTLGKNSSGTINLYVMDVNSRARFLDVSMTKEDFANALFGLAEVECKLKVRALDKIGKVKESMPIEVKMPKGVDNWRDKDKAYKEACKTAPEGWEVQNYFNSQNSFFTKDGEDWARTTACRWV